MKINISGRNEPPRSKLRGISRLVAALKTKQASGNITRRDLIQMLTLKLCLISLYKGTFQKNGHMLSSRNR